MQGKHSKSRKEVEEEVPRAFRKDNEKNNKNKKSGKKNSFLKILGKILLVILIIIIIIVAVALGYINSKLGKMKETNIDASTLGISEEVNENLSEYRNIALFGVDSRSDEYGVGNRSDCIIIASINNKTKEVRLISVYRDTYVQIEGHRLDKITHAYSYGAEQLAINTLNKNLDLNITEAVTVNFDAVAEAVDALGGVNITVDNEEIKHINGYIDETSQVTGIKSSHVTQAGNQTLDGVQAVAYSRIRYTAGGDYKRTERMRDVITAMVDKAKTKSLTQLNTIADKILPLIRTTNLTRTDIISMATNLMSYKMTESIGWPYETKGKTMDRWYGIPVTLESNVKKLHQELFGENEYEPSENVKNISNNIINKTGYK